MLAANTGPSSQVAASPRTCRNSTGSTRFWATSKPAWVAPTMRSISPNTERVTSVRLFIVSTGASILRRFLFVYSSLLPLLDLARHVFFFFDGSKRWQDKYRAKIIGEYWQN